MKKINELKTSRQTWHDVTFYTSAEEASTHGLVLMYEDKRGSVYGIRNAEAVAAGNFGKWDKVAFVPRSEHMEEYAAQAVEEIPPVVYTVEEWTKDGEFNAKAGQEISEEIYNIMLNCIPSKPLPQKKARQALRVYNIPVHFGFLMGEPHSCDKEGNQLYLAFGGNDFGRSVNQKEPRYYYLGLSRTASRLNGFYYFFECLGLIFNGDQTGLPDNVAPAATFEGDDDAIAHAVDFEATLYKYEYKDGELINIMTLYEPKY